MRNNDKDLTKLDKLILTELSKKPNQKAADLSRLIGVDRKEINQRLYKLKSRVQQNSEYRWSIVAAELKAKRVCSYTYALMFLFQNTSATL